MVIVNHLQAMVWYLRWGYLVTRTIFIPDSFRHPLISDVLRQRSRVHFGDVNQLFILAQVSEVRVQIPEVCWDVFKVFEIGDLI